MDLDTIDPRSIDVAHVVDKLRFGFYSEEEALRLSVRRLTSPFAFDDLGRPFSRGLYDPALGPSSYKDGPCPTCGLGYINCPGHFGHIELPVPLPNPLLIKLIVQIMKCSCWNCHCLRVNPRDLKLLLARLYFEDAGMPKCGHAVYSFMVLRRRKGPTDEESLAEQPDSARLKSSFIFNWRAYLRGLPKPIAKYVRHLGSNDAKLVEKKILQSAHAAWKEAAAANRLLKLRSVGWRHTQDTILKFMAACPNCGKAATSVRVGDRSRLFYSESRTQILLSPTEIESHIAALWKTHPSVFELLFGLQGRSLDAVGESSGHRRLFVKVALVPPSRFRPTQTVGTMDYASEHPQNIFFQRILTEIEVIMKANEQGLRPEDASDDSDNEAEEVERPSKKRFAEAMSNMQEALRDLYDSAGMSGSSGRVQMTGIRQQIEAKDGALRKHMMGKRVNYSCRSVIGPDVFLDTNELGIPESFAKLLTVPEPVTATNLKEMQSAVLNGPDVYPGAVAVEDWTTTGSHRVVKFRSSKDRRRLVAQAGLLLQNQIENGSSKTNGLHNGDAASEAAGMSDISSAGTSVPKRVHRHLRTGDVVLFNRQPTLHRVSIMAHKVRVLPRDRTLRFHYANCGSYNADFDGDEMNVHVPQDYLARAEAEELLLSSKHYIVPTSGAPIRGLIQDHIAAATLLSRRDAFIEREEFTQYLYAATEKLMNCPARHGTKYVIPEPALYKPRRLWTGKQLISAILFVVRDGRPGLNLEADTRTKSNVIGKEESLILFRNGLLLRGVIDKSSLGAAMYGIVHAIQEAYGCDASDEFLSAMSRLCVFFMRSHGHTTGVDDLLLQEHGDLKRRRILAEAAETIGTEVTNAVYAEMSQTDQQLRTAKSLPEARTLLEEMIRRDGKEAEDRLDTSMKTALNKVSSAVTQECIPAALRKAFPKNGFALMTNTGAKGSAVNSAQISCLLGSTVLEGKRVPRMGGSGATLPCFAPFDASPNAGGFVSGRFLTGISPQEFFFHSMSGREGLLDTSLKTANSGYLQRCLIKHLEGIRLHYDYTVRDSDQTILQFIYGDDGIDPSKSRWLNTKIEWQLANQQCLQDPVQKSSKCVGQKDVSTLKKMRRSGTLLEELSPGALSQPGVVSESFEAAIDATVKRSTAGDRESIRGFLYDRYRSAALEPGEAVGVVAAQGVGEPSTQMTLNTFHHTGSSSAHVTLGIPRLRELLMTASKNPKTPCMKLPICAKDPQHGAKRLCRELQKINLLDLITKISVREQGIRLAPGECQWAIRTCEILLQFPPESLYKKQLELQFASIKTFVGRFFLARFHDLVNKELGKVSSDIGGFKEEAISAYEHVAERPRELQAESREGDQLTSEDDDDDDETSSALNGLSNMQEETADDTSDLGLASSSDEEGRQSDEDDVEELDTRKHAKALMKQEMDATLEEADEEIDETPMQVKGAKVKKKRRRPTFGSVGNPNKAFLDLSASGHLGYVPMSFQDIDGETLRFAWGLPVALWGRIDITGIAKEAARGLKIREVPQISRCFVESDANGVTVVTEGSNICAIIEKGQGLIDFNRLLTNDMHGILERYGVEALRQSLIQELRAVFKANGIPVDIRHLSLIADYMTNEGSYRGFNRQSMYSTPSPFQKMTFETSIKFLTESALNGTYDDMKSPSAAIGMGQVYEGGTGGFELMERLR